MSFPAFGTDDQGKRSERGKEEKTQEKQGGKAIEFLYFVPKSVMLKNNTLLGQNQFAMSCPLVGKPEGRT